MQKKKFITDKKTECMSVVDDSAGTKTFPLFIFIFYFFTATFVNMCHGLTRTLCVRMYMLVYIQTGWCMGLIPCIGFTIDQPDCGLLLTVAWEPQSTYREQIHTECSTVWFLGLELGMSYESRVIRQSGEWSGQILVFSHHNRLMPALVRLIK